MFVAREFLEPRDAALALRLASAGARAYPFEFAFERLLPRGFGGFFLREAILFLLEPRAVVALPRDSAPPVEFEDPLGGVVEEIAVVRHRDDRAGKAP